MPDTVSWLITILYGNELLRCALKVKKDKLQGDCAECPMEPENRLQIHKSLPPHVRSCGPIVAVDHIFDVTVKE